MEQLLGDFFIELPNMQTDIVHVSIIFYLIGALANIFYNVFLRVEVIEQSDLLRLINEEIFIQRQKVYEQDGVLLRDLDLMKLAPDAKAKMKAELLAQCNELSQKLEEFQEKRYNLLQKHLEIERKHIWYKRMIGLGIPIVGVVVGGVVGLVKVLANVCKKVIE